MTVRGLRNWWPLWLVLGLLLAAVLAPVAAPFAPDAVSLADRRQAPSLVHWFGTDELGRDVLTRVWYGARVSLAVGVLSALLATALGALVGGVGGYRRGWMDAILMRLTDGMLAVPRLPLLMIAAAILQPSIPLLIVLVGTVGWMETARVVRADVLSLSQRPFVEAARASGARDWRIVPVHILPNAAPALAVSSTLAVGRAILLESALSFFGVGVQPPDASWGNMLYQAQTTMTTEPWLALFPGLMIFVAVLAINMLGERLAAGTRAAIR
ncbi:MAG: Dipeptide transport system permease protein DppC [Gemmatimonadaceae bacterium]|nr:Dipeptide transport system permease protein DppC [Gemmatimonadaceae bacterium]